MTIKTLWNLFADGDEYKAFERVENKLSRRPDLHALLLLDKLVPGHDSLTSFACSDNVYLTVTPEQLAVVASQQDIVDLNRSGVNIDSEGLYLSL